MIYYLPSLHILVLTQASLKERRIPLLILFLVFFSCLSPDWSHLVDTSGKSIKVPNPASRPADLTYFTFCSTVLAQTVHCRAPLKSIILEFSLHLPQSFRFYTLLSTITSITDNTLPLIPTPPQTVANLEFTFGNLSDDILFEMDQAELSNLLITTRDTITKPLSTLLLPMSVANLLSTPYGMSTVANIPSSTPKMDRVRSNRSF